MSLTPEIRHQLGLKRGQHKHLIYHELGLRNWNGVKVARKLGCSRNNVSETIRGNNHSVMVLDALIEIGVPEKYLFDPRHMEKSNMENV